MKEVTAVFDIGKTNKKCFLFDKNYRVVYENYQQFDETEDEDGFPCDDLNAIKKWLFKSLEKLFSSRKYHVHSINFSTYGASFVHIDQYGKVLTPLYNYLKPLPAEIIEKFHNTYVSPENLAVRTASPPAGMLNSGMQLYWLKKTQPALFRRIRYSLHLPQYLSYILTGIPVSEPTSIGCHTSLWDYQRKDYHRWVYAEELHRQLPFSIPTSTFISTRWKGRQINVGIGIHDSSSALLPYILSQKKPFLLVSTGTWSVTLNPFSQSEFSSNDLKNDCLFYQTMEATPVRASKLFLGHEHKEQVKYLSKYFKKDYGVHRGMPFDPKRHERLNVIKDKRFNFLLSGSAEELNPPNLKGLTNFEDAYHRLVFELVEYQIESMRRAMGQTKIKKIFIDGGFADNDIYTTLIDRNFPDIKVRITRSPLGSALGAALVMRRENVSPKFLKVHYGLRKIADTLRK